MLKNKANIKVELLLRQIIYLLLQQLLYFNRQFSINQFFII